MKKILLALTSLLLNNSVFASVVSSPINQPIISTLETQEESLFLDVPSITQIGSDYCAPASLVSIFSYWGWEKDKTQSQIYQEVRAATESPVEIPGVPFNNLLAIYMNDFIQKTTGKETRYYYNAVDATFGISLEDIAIFSTYVWSSLSLNVPLLMGIHPIQELGHAVVLCGYEENLDNHWYDQYTFMDPFDGKFFDIIARDIHRDFKYGMGILGYGDMLTISDQVEINIDSFTKEIRDIPGNNQPVFVAKIGINLTKYTGISDFSYFYTAFSIFGLPNFKSEIKKVNDDPDIKEGLALSSNVLPKKNVDEWIGKNTVIHSFSEVIGCETIKTWLRLKIALQREQNNDLVIWLVFYGGAKVTKDKNFKDSDLPYELTGRIKINSSSTFVLKRKQLYNYQFLSK
ncbi:papain like cysteine protease AvrRpt2 [Entomoplasma freundtii]|uniref:Uncharacterized protein n=1 Tax=Entomoplasma freundtii TaxID=74700 RepID=A0A2K8NQQ4_9MOLU|nr:C39 family peptidase [Entomoplasma freundtii]ATZ16149.1 hypothetical protein EFREU_v1c01220 [Entomoplasma freundtii]TDY56950.1 papain like cysteine protease AvrRpt2 [Entomoplasma freundtii]